MPSFKQALKWIFVLGPVVTHALPVKEARQESGAPSGGLSDIDILNFALTAEHLESEFYRQGFAKFPDSDFMALGLSAASIASLKMVGQTEATHVSFLTSAIAAAGAQPVQQCTYNFGFTDAATMVATAKVLEAIGVSAYLGAAPLINSSAILGQAATIATVEARHQTFIRSAASKEPIPAAFDTPLQPRAVFTLAAPFIQSCPPGSNLAITPFPSIALQNPAAAIPGNDLILADANQPGGAQFCAFAAPGGAQFAPLTGGKCTVPQGLQGEVYMMVTKSQSIEDSEILAGPAVLSPS
ncbi:hypothetical protein EJ05DRAFT_185703 [Pseudovirgaria hyperparasitica]|uniref:Twin-arginine translocation pathway signal n=1 Tax=Pseudovirgaria hyperparasitica TaxID=470096 RepID=A0A6A6WJW3_9PEZI|nr:uncharacterized protein EJ05DRAFT_185703 [Pseudovirgaria hyperparasitica]KAF2761811.1 hypothetical protein EJ05DRAFT_185703 [Pseudovirgaria hyperparasitica]